ncbi:M20/M25/M40 family metallo-hydrolase [Mycobacterium yunnanensis]|uniref:M20/M25/M40 family metallo-hydrolase n=2 Tax=Mycobacterium yunnanensis TaxID=368477 RepID=A0A9X2YXN3_9MYCO|nr:M20/M25/M40 family metallo-hydrolase [Mycobacterium yunnanensis]
MDICISEARRTRPMLRVHGDLDSAHPWALLTNDARPHANRLLFACHVDTVPVGVPSDWEFDPLGGDIDNGHLLGRGSVDMKAGLVAAVAALADASDDTPLALLLTSDEEVGSLGAERAVPALSEHRFGAVIIPEATSNTVHLGHRGALWLEIVARGVAAHGSTPHLGVNAIHQLLDVLQRARTELPLATHPDLRQSTWNLGQLNGGTVPNIVPAAASAIVDHRTVGDQEQLLHWWASQPEIDEIHTLIDLPAVWTPSETPWLETLPAVVSHDAVSYFTDGSYIAQALPGVPIVVWGPGHPTAMHAVDERVAISDLELATAHFGSAVDSWGHDS